MAVFNVELPSEIIKDFEKLHNNADEIFKAMTRAGAEEVASMLKATVPRQEFAKYCKLTRSYRTPSDGGWNTKVAFYGHLPLKDGRKLFSRRGGNGTIYTTDKGIPVEFLINMFEYGRSNAPFPKKPFVRKAFKQKEAIERVMLETQKQASGGLLDE